VTFGAGNAEATPMTARRTVILQLSSSCQREKNIVSVILSIINVGRMTGMQTAMFPTAQ